MRMLSYVVLSCLHICPFSLLVFSVCSATAADQHTAEFFKLADRENTGFVTYTVSTTVTECVLSFVHDVPYMQ